MQAIDAPQGPAGGRARAQAASRKTAVGKTAARKTGRCRRTVLLGLFLSGQAAVLASAADHIVTQKNRAFDLREIAVTPGDTVQFRNDDEFLHQIFIAAPALNFDSAEQPPGQTIAVKFPAGVFEVLCHIHPKMRLVVTAR